MSDENSEYVPLLLTLQRWYLDQCDGDWEHSYGVKIETLDNPGWLVQIDLVGTSLEDEEFSPISELEDSVAWVDCRLKDGKFVAAGGPHMLERLLTIFLTWARNSPKS